MRALLKTRESITRVQNHASQLRKSREHKNKMQLSEKFPGIPGRFQRCAYSS